MPLNVNVTLTLDLGFFACGFSGFANFGPGCQVLVLCKNPHLESCFLRYVSSHTIHTMGVVDTIWVLIVSTLPGLNVPK